MSSLNLDPNSYTHSELKKLLSLADDYTHHDIIKHKQRLLHQLNRDDTNKTDAHNITAFLDVITEKLTSAITTPLESANIKPAIINIEETNTNYDKPNAITQHDSNFIITNENTMAGLSAKSQDGRLVSVATPAGYMNPINVRTIEQSLNIDSRFRKNYYTTQSTNFSVTLPEPQKNVVKMSVDSIEFPLSYYAISANNKNNTFVVIESAASESCTNIKGNAWRVTLPDGNYEPSWMQENMAMPFEEAMTNALAEAEYGTVNDDGTFTAPTPPTTTPCPLTFVIDRTSGKSIFTGSSVYTIRFNVDIDGNLSMTENIQIRLGWLLGFRAAQYISSSTSPCSIVSEGICYPAGPTYGFLSINDYQNNTAPVFLQAFSQSLLDNNIILKMNLSTELGGNTVYKSSDTSAITSIERKQREYFGPVNIQKLDVALYDEYGRIIDLNNMDMSLTLRFEKLYD
tara:strand:- start:5528 stop:6898 length:1371 start_codon:yes stop_codon:yes gene_type:complete